MDPLVSIIVPAYQREDLIRETLLSALEQRFDSFEVVLVDNHSADRTFEVAQAMARDHARLRVFRNDENLGPVRNWLQCLSHARGEYAKVLFSDDLIAPNCLERTHAVLAADPAVGFVFTPAVVGSVAWQGEVYYAWKERDRLARSGEFIRTSLLTNDLPVSPGCALFRAADLRDSLEHGLQQYPEFGRHGAGIDQHTFLFTASRYPQVAFLSRPLAFFRIHPTSLTVDGLGGDIRRDYDIARCAFAERNELPRLIQARVRLISWLRAMERTGAPVSPATYFPASPAGALLLGLALGQVPTKPFLAARSLRAMLSRA